uniref:CCHC-type domain-containing protein n=1 Tax=Caenorhabditis japonica TaxID=281687 RepID=A0A8R1IJ06_CAEJA
MEDNESEVMKVEMALDVLDGTQTSGTKGSELSVEKRHVDIKQRRKLFKNFARIRPTKKKLWERFEEIGHDKWPRSVLRLIREQKLQTVEGLREQCERGSLVDRSSTKEGEENHQDELIWFKKEKERLEARIRECEAEKLRAEKLMRRAQRTVEKERKTAEELSRSLQQATRVLERLRRYGGMNQCFRCGGVGHVVRQCTSRPVQKVDTVKKARKAKMVEPMESLGQRRRFEVESGAVVSAMSTDGWERSKRRSSKWEKEVEVLAKPNFRGPPQSRAQVTAKAKAGLGQFIRKEAVKQCVPTSLCLKREGRKVTGVMSNPLFIKRNGGIGVGSRSTTRCPPKATRWTVDTVDRMSQDKTRWVPREQKRLVPEHESVTNRWLGRSRSGNESWRDAWLRTRARRLERRRHVSADK